MAAQIGSLDYVMLWARDVEGLVAAYRSALDAIPIEESYPGWARIRLGNIDIGIRADAEALATEPARGRGAELVFRIHDVASLRAQLLAAAFEVEAYTEIPGGVLLPFRDPARNALAAIQWGTSLAEVEASSRTDAQ